MSLKIVKKTDTPKLKWKDARCSQCTFFLYSDADSIISRTESPDEGYCGCETAELNSKEVRYDKEACNQFEACLTIINKD